MSHIAVSGLAYAHPGGELLFSDVSFRIAPGAHVGLIGANGVGKSTLLRIIAGELEADDGDAGRVVASATWRRTSASATTSAAFARAAAVARPDARSAQPGSRCSATRPSSPRATRRRDAARSAIADWSSLGGYELEGQWDACLPADRPQLIRRARRAAGA